MHVFYYIYANRVSWVAHYAMESNVCLMQIFGQFWRQSQIFNGHLVENIQRRCYHLGCPYGQLNKDTAEVTTYQLWTADFSPPTVREGSLLLI